MSPEEVLKKLTTTEGPCGRLCAYCPEEFDLRGIKECMETLLKTNYELRQDHEILLQDFIKLKAAYLYKTGEDYHDD